MSCDKLCLAAVLLLTNASLAAAAQGRSANAGAPLLSESYTRLLNALTSGRSVMVTTNFNQCTVVSTGASGPPIAGGFLIRDYIVPNHQYIGFADVVEILGRTMSW
jgi:VirK protein